MLQTPQEIAIWTPLKDKRRRCPDFGSISIQLRISAASAESAKTHRQNLTYPQLSSRAVKDQSPYYNLRSYAL